MRERLAKALAALLTVLVVSMAAFFADRRNPAEAPPAPESPVVLPEPPVDPSRVALGQAVFERESCARCHSADGRGNPRSPLDGVGARHPPARLRDWVTGSGSARDQLTRSTLRAKERFAELPEEDLEALVAYLSSLR